MTEQECNMRVAALSLQVSILHTALRGVIRVADRKTDEFDAARAAVDVSEPECADLLRLARETAEEVIHENSTWATPRDVPSAVALRALLDRIGYPA